MVTEGVLDESALGKRIDTSFGSLNIVSEKSAQAKPTPAHFRRLAPP